MSTASILKAVRLTHHNLGVFIAPAVLFFSFTGFVQTFSLHEAIKGRAYTPPAILVTLGNIHKKASLPGPPRPQGPPPPKAEGPRPDGAKPDAAKPGGPPQAPKGPPPPSSFHWPEKIFFGVVAVGLFTSTLTGLFMAWKYTRRKIVVVALFVAGIVLPVLLLPF